MWIGALILWSQLGHAADLPQGVFHRSCYTVSSDSDTNTLDAQLEIQGNQWTHTHTAFEDDKCQKAYLIFAVTSKAIVLNDNLDLMTEEVSYVSLTDEVSRALNQISYCGFKDWRTGQKKTVTGRSCEDFQAPKAGQVIYSRWKSIGTQLFLGMPSAQKDGASPELRFDDMGDGPYFPNRCKINAFLQCKGRNFISH